jgi:hypothetical protein
LDLESDLITARTILRSGINFTNRAELKYARAVHLVNELRGRIDEWTAAETLIATVHQIDPHTVELRLGIRREPPIDEWSLILGDALHNLRSVLDTLVWAIATLDGAKPKNPGQVTFPLTNNEDDWNKRIASLESVPPPLLDRIRQLQPWRHGVERTDSMLWLLHRFDIVDKHTGLISGALHFKQLSLGEFDLNLEPQETALSAKPTILMKEQPVEMEQGAVLASFHCDSHSMRPDPNYLGKVWVQFALATEDDRRVLIDAFLADVLSRTREWIDIICAGEMHAKALKEARTTVGANAIFGDLDEEGNARMKIFRFEPETSSS